MKAEKRVAESEETSVGERVPEQEDMEDFYEMRCIESSETKPEGIKLRLL